MALLTFKPYYIVCIFLINWIELGGNLYFFRENNTCFSLGLGFLTWSNSCTQSSCIAKTFFKGVSDRYLGIQSVHSFGLLLLFSLFSKFSNFPLTIGWNIFWQEKCFWIFRRYLLKSLNLVSLRSVKFRMNLWGHRFSQNANQKLPRFLPYPLINFQGKNLGNFWLAFWEKRWPHKFILNLTDLYIVRT